MSFSHLSRPIRSVTGKTFARKFITLGRVIQYWPDIVGADLALKAYPVGMKVRKAPGPKESKKFEATLEISATSADATLIHYQKPLILERMRTLLGDSLVVDIRTVHGGPQAPLARSPKATRLTPPEKNALSGLDIVNMDPDLAQALQNLGRWVE